MEKQSTVDTITERLRSKIRVYAAEQRERMRENNIDALRFGLGEIKSKIEEIEHLTTDDVKGLAMRIKRRKGATVDDMYRLSHAFLQNLENINTFANTTGAMQVLIKELTSGNGKHQVYALECFCNLSLGESAICSKISNMAGTYLVVTCLSMNDEQLKRVALWTIANILATPGKGSALLLILELLPKLWNLFADDECSNLKDYRVDAAICLQQIAINSSSLLSIDDNSFLRQHLMSKNPTCEGSEYFLQILFHCKLLSIKANLTETEIIFVINTALGHLSRINQLADNASRLCVYYAVRILANIVSIYLESFDLLLKQLHSVWQTNLLQLLNKIFSFREDALTVETLWLLKNLLLFQYKCSELQQLDFLSKLRIYTTNTVTMNEI